jgi:hypothetical protein
VKEHKTRAAITCLRADLLPDTEGAEWLVEELDGRVVAVSLGLNTSRRCLRHSFLSHCMAASPKERHLIDSSNLLKEAIGGW